MKFRDIRVNSLLFVEIQARQLEIPAKELEIPAEELGIPTEELKSHAKELETPAEELKIPAEELKIPAKERGIPAEELEIPARELEMTQKPWKSHKNHGNSRRTRKNEASCSLYIKRLAAYYARPFFVSFVFIPPRPPSGLLLLRTAGSVMLMRSALPAVFRPRGHTHNDIGAAFTAVRAMACSDAQEP